MALCLSRAQLSHGSHCDVVVNDGIPDRQGGSVWGATLDAADDAVSFTTS